MMPISIFKILGAKFTDDTRIIKFLKSIKENEIITICSNDKVMDFNTKEILKFIDDIITEKEKDLKLLEDDMIEMKYIEDNR